jgi:hypothetical protein
LIPGRGGLFELGGTAWDSCIVGWLGEEGKLGGSDWIVVDDGEKYGTFLFSRGAMLVMSCSVSTDICGKEAW